MAQLRRLSILCAVSLIAACGGQAPEETPNADEAAIQVAVKQIGATVVSPGIYRSKRPTQADLAALKAAGVKYILDLENDSGVIATEAGWAKSLGMTFVSEQMSGFWYPNDSQVNRIEAWLADPTHRPVLVHCQHGEDRTGLIIGLYRVFHQGFSPAKAYAEMLANGFHKALFLLNHYYESKTGWED